MLKLGIREHKIIKISIKESPEFIILAFHENLLEPKIGSKIGFNPKKRVGFGRTIDGGLKSTYTAEPFPTARQTVLFGMTSWLNFSLVSVLRHLKYFPMKKLTPIMANISQNIKHTKSTLTILGVAPIKALTTTFIPEMEKKYSSDKICNM